VIADVRRIQNLTEQNVPHGVAVGGCGVNTKTRRVALDGDGWVNTVVREEWRRKPEEASSHEASCAAAGLNELENTESILRQTQCADYVTMKSCLATAHLVA
jgi:hypothetical protein